MKLNCSLSDFSQLKRGFQRSTTVLSGKLKVFFFEEAYTFYAPGLAQFMLSGSSMNFWVFSLITRIIGGERLRKATPNEYRFYSAFFMFAPVFLILSTKFGKLILDNAAPIRIWIFFTSACSVFFFGILLWSKHVPAKISWTLGGVVWAITIFLALTNRFGP